MRGPFCTPRISGSRWTRKNNRLSPMSLLDRFREAVLKLILLSALTKTANNGRKYSANAAQRSSSSNYNPYEPHQSEAVADCIEFIKKSVTTEAPPQAAPWTAPLT
ncbi:unnamed protein product [Coffea canephora]|uniref:Uncharacterized protein n=1 Tax=Coffea canephora TaxID=49390 RepID=A0A068U067_COFCA|nr:unnamed protein product [Coffea canephora]